MRTTREYEWLEFYQTWDSSGMKASTQTYRIYLSTSYNSNRLRLALSTHFSVVAIAVIAVWTKPGTIVILHKKEDTNWSANTISKKNNNTDSSKLREIIQARCRREKVVCSNTNKNGSYKGPVLPAPLFGKKVQGGKWRVVRPSLL